MDKDFYSEINAFWGRIYQFNYDLMKKSENLSLEGKYKFTDIIDFHITSNALSLLKNMIFDFQSSIGSLHNVRCIIEGLSLKKMYECGDISEENVELLQKQVFLIEYKEYSKFSIVDKILLPEKLQKDFEDAKKFYCEKLTNRFDEKHIEKIIKSQIPFLCDPGINYRKLASKYLGEQFTEIYGICSQFIHPSKNTSYKLKEFHAFLLIIYNLLKKEYGCLPEVNKNLAPHYSLSMHSDIAQRIFKLIDTQGQLIYGIADVFMKKYNGYVPDTLITMAMLNQEMILDCLMGFREQTKVKYKIMLELLAGFQYNYFEKQLSQQYTQLFCQHADLLLKRNFGLTVDLADAYKIYLDIYPDGCNKDKFEKMFLRPTGYTIDEKGDVISLKKLVEQLLKVSFGDKAQDFLDSILLDYTESQMLSHANGYMWFANKGAWADVYNLFRTTDMLIIHLLSKMHFLFKMHKEIECDKSDKQIINVIRNAIQRIKPLAEERWKLLLVPVVDI